jgi:hypothetical protein
METYTQKEVQQIAKRYSEGDEEAGKLVDGLARGRMRDHGDTYSDALRFVLQAPAQKISRREDDVEKISAAGKELDGVAKGIMRTGAVAFRSGTVQVGQVNYSEALKLATISNPSLGEQYTGHEIMSDREAFAHVKKTYGNRAQSRRYSADDFTTLSNIIVGYKYPHATSIDWQAALNAVMAQPVSVRQGAADYFLQTEADRLKRNIPEGPFGAPDEAGRMTRVRTRYPDVAAMADNGAATVDALKEMYWTHE